MDPVNILAGLALAALLLVVAPWQAGIALREAKDRRAARKANPA